MEKVPILLLDLTGCSKEEIERAMKLFTEERKEYHRALDELMKLKGKTLKELVEELSIAELEEILNQQIKKQKIQKKIN